MCERAFETLSSEEIAFIQERMLPGKVEEENVKRMSESGFLLPGESLKEVYEADRKFLEKVNITYDQIADVLMTLVGKASRVRQLQYEKTKEAWPKEGYLVDRRYRVQITTYMGAQQCPFQDPTDKHYYGYEYGSADLAIKDEKTGRTLTFNTLLPHMIRHHHFFESPNVSHRVNPSDVIEMFEIKPGQNTKPTYWTEYYWSQGSSSTGMDVHAKAIYTRACEVLMVEKYESSRDQVVCYMIPCELPISQKELVHIGNLIIEPGTWEERYRKARRYVFEHLNENRRDDKANNRSWAVKEMTEEEMQSKIEMELDLVRRYQRNDPQDRPTGLDHCLIHPQDSRYHMHIMTMMLREGSLDGWSRKKTNVFSMAIGTRSWQALPATPTPMTSG